MSSGQVLCTLKSTSYREKFDRRSHHRPLIEGGDDEPAWWMRAGIIQSLMRARWLIQYEEPRYPFGKPIPPVTIHRIVNDEIRRHYGTGFENAHARNPADTILEVCPDVLVGRNDKNRPRFTSSLFRGSDKSIELLERDRRSLTSVVSRLGFGWHKPPCSLIFAR